MVKTFYFLKEVMDSLFEHIVVLDEKGKIVFTNKAWDDFAKENDCLIQKEAGPESIIWKFATKQQKQVTNMAEKR
jgi:transcriptional regulator with PAS, ATPase and Fis domain